LFAGSLANLKTHRKEAGTKSMATSEMRGDRPMLSDFLTIVPGNTVYGKLLPAINLAGEAKGKREFPWF
jgi:hypothetical protein